MKLYLPMDIVSVSQDDTIKTEMAQPYMGKAFGELTSGMFGKDSKIRLWHFD